MTNFSLLEIDDNDLLEERHVNNQIMMINEAEVMIIKKSVQGMSDISKHTKEEQGKN